MPNPLILRTMKSLTIFLLSMLVSHASARENVQDSLQEVMPSDSAMTPRLEQRIVAENTTQGSDQEAEGEWGDDTAIQTTEQRPFPATTTVRLDGMRLPQAAYRLGVAIVGRKKILIHY